MSEVSAPDERPSSTTLASLRTRWGALRNIGPFMGMVWQASPVLSSAAVGLRLLRALIPVVSLWVAKLLIDEVVRLTASRGDHTTLSSWFASGEIDHLLLLVGLEFGLAIASDLLSRLVGLVDSLLSETLTMATSLR